jgi:hypothetical protein
MGAILLPSPLFDEERIRAIGTLADFGFSRREISHEKEGNECPQVYGCKHKATRIDSSTNNIEDFELYCDLLKSFAVSLPRSAQGLLI